MKKSALLIGSLIFSSLVFNSCKKGDGGGGTNPNPTSGKNYKFTITASGFQGGDDFTLILGGGDMNGAPTLWKVNGVTRNNERTISLTEADFSGGKTYVIESATPLLTVQGSLQAINFDATPITFDFLPVVNGTDGVRITQTVTKDFSRQLSF